MSELVDIQLDLVRQHTVDYHAKLFDLLHPTTAVKIHNEYVHPHGSRETTCCKQYKPADAIWVIVATVAGYHYPTYLCDNDGACLYQQAVQDIPQRLPLLKIK